MFYLYLKSIYHVCLNQILKFVDDENDLQHMYVVLGYNILTLYLADNNLVHFCVHLL